MITQSRVSNRRFAALLGGLLIAMLSLAAPTLAAAQDEAAAQEQALAGPGAVVISYASPMRQQCMEELSRDAGWKADLKGQLAPEVHAEDAQQMLTNRRHVVMAYASLWVILLAFVVFLWNRQRGLRAEIARLESDVAAATRDA
ncbi:hypothetical protein [Haliangium ochraceum]|uniref:CcmD family protein n=1 Tax=Haliangium ochraceum (strain DSM 14365 / JCM 11303 / SMP-2) TaxID=502025 RepID=D0LV23_HALO1|nr:hypothetical protein [Haliangium ochraceum]ACY15864.1 hypothetical protein Hoch_3362 [Haliangium ochraceum DSM 14365]